MCCSHDVGLVMSPMTGNVLPLCNVIFDDEFSTFPFLQHHRTLPHWSKIVNQSWYLATDQSFQLSNDWETLPAPNYHTPHLPVSEGPPDATQSGEASLPGIDSP